MLTDLEIKQAILNKDIQIDPYNEKQLESGNYRIKLGSKLLIPRKGLRVSFGSSEEQELYDEFDLSQQSYILKPKEFVLGQTIEQVALDKDIAAILDGRSTFARLGVSIHQSSQFIAPGQDFHIITLEIFNAGDFEVELTMGTKVGKLLFFKFNGNNLRAYKDYGRYHGQQETTGAIIN